MLQSVSGTRGPRFKSGHPDENKPNPKTRIARVVECKTAASWWRRGRQDSSALYERESFLRSERPRRESAYREIAECHRSVVRERYNGVELRVGLHDPLCRVSAGIEKRRCPTLQKEVLRRGWCDAQRRHTPTGALFRLGNVLLRGSAESRMIGCDSGLRPRHDPNSAALGEAGGSA
jgi:hypothetical protein